MVLHARDLHNISDKVDRYIRKKSGANYLALFHPDKKYERVFNRIRYLIMLKSNISDNYSHKYSKIKIDSDDDLPLEKALNVVMFIKPFLNKNHNHYYYHVFLNVYINTMSVIYFNRIDVSEDVGGNKTSL